MKAAVGGDMGDMRMNFVVVAAGVVVIGQCIVLVDFVLVLHLLVSKQKVNSHLVLLDRPAGSALQVVLGLAGYLVGEEMSGVWDDVRPLGSRRQRIQVLADIGNEVDHLHRKHLVELAEVANMADTALEPMEVAVEVVVAEGVLQKRKRKEYDVFGLVKRQGMAAGSSAVP